MLSASSVLTSIVIAKDRYIQRNIIIHGLIEISKIIFRNSPPLNPYLVGKLDGVEKATSRGGLFVEEEAVQAHSIPPQS